MTSMRRILLSGIVLGLIAALVLSGQDYLQQQKHRQVLPVVDYDSVLEWSAAMGQDLDDMLWVIKNNNIDTIAMTELELTVEENYIRGFFQQDELVHAFLGRDIIKTNQAELGSNSWLAYLADYKVSPTNIYLYVASRARAEALYAAGSKKYGEERVKKLVVESDKIIIEVMHSEALPVNGFGFDASLIAEIKGYGFKVLPRPVNAAYLTSDAVVFESYLRYLSSEFNSEAIIFAGTEGILGMPVKSGDNLLAVTARNLRQQDSSHPLYGHIEMTAIDGDKKLAALLDYNLARVHSIGANEWLERYNAAADELTINSVVERFMLAVNDRSAHIIYLRPFLKSVDFNHKFFSSLTQRIESRGYQLGAITPVPSRTALPLWALLLISLGLGSALLLLLTQLTKAVRLIAVLLGLGVLAVTGIVFALPSYHLLLQKLVALTSAIVFPTLAIVWGFIWYSSKAADNKIVAMKRLVITIGVTFVGCIYVHGILATAEFMTAISVFPMVKVALLVPALLVFAIMLFKNQAKNSIIKILNINIKVYHAVIAGIFIIAIGFLVIRSGNNPIIAVTSIELKIRLWLQQVLIARPRFKEFLIGYPMLILAAWLGYKQRQTLIPLTIGAIGLASFINTFAHLHKPLWMALLTSFNGIWSGTLVGIVLVALFELVERSGLLSIWGD